MESPARRFTGSHRFVGPTLAFNMAHGIQYFGYFASVWEGVGTGDYIGTTAPIANTVFISGDVQQVKRKLEEAQAHGMAAILLVQDLFFPDGSWHLAPNYAASFANFHTAIAQYDPIIAGYYVADEPYWQNSNASGSAGLRVPPSTLYNALTEAIAAINTTTPGKATAIFFSTYEMKPGEPPLNLLADQIIPPNLDWVGFDCYASDPVGCSTSNVSHLFWRLHTLKQPEQAIIVALDGFWPALPSDFDKATISHAERAIVSDRTQETIEATIIRRIQVWQSLINASDQVIAIFPFLYQTAVTESETLFGAEHMPAVRAWLEEYYNGLAGSVRCAGNDLIRVNAAGTEVDRWAEAPMCVPRCEGPDLIRFDILGVEIERWRSAPMCVFP